MSYLKFKWTKKGEQYVFTGQAQASLAQQQDVDAEVVAIWRWLARNRLASHQFTFEATRHTATSKNERLTIDEGRLVSDGHTVFHPQETRLILALPEAAAVQFRFSFDVVDDRN